MVALALFVGIPLAAQQWPGRLLAAEADQAKSPATTMALIDVAYIFKNHKAFLNRMKALEQKGQVIQQTMKVTEARLQAMKERLEKATDKNEKKQLEAELAKQGTDHQLSTRSLQSEVLEEEARIYFETYSVLQAESKKYCRARGIVIVFKFDREAINVDDRKSVMTGLARPIIFSDAPDISEEILKAMDAAAESTEAKAKAETKSR